MSKLEVVGKTFSTDMVIAAHAMRENHYAFSRTKSEISYVSNLQDKHNASSIYRMCWQELPPAECKNRKNP